jgi:hypothetical protein
MLNEFLVLGIAQAPSDLVLPLGFYRAAVCEAEFLALLRELRVNAGVQSVGHDDRSLWHVVLDEPHDEVSHGRILSSPHALDGEAVGPDFPGK